MFGDFERKDEIESRLRGQISHAGFVLGGERVEGELHRPARRRVLREDLREHGLRLDADDARTAGSEAREEVRRRAEPAAELEDGPRPEVERERADEEDRKVDAVDMEVRAGAPVAACSPERRVFAAPHQLGDAGEVLVRHRERPARLGQPGLGPRDRVGRGRHLRAREDGAGPTAAERAARGLGLDAVVQTLGQLHGVAQFDHLGARPVVRAAPGRVLAYETTRARRVAGARVGNARHRIRLNLQLHDLPIGGRRQDEEGGDQQFCHLSTFCFALGDKARPKATTTPSSV
mmetsp:Transcript_19582/g.57989  ORF Transcript_19582/g.57989 Transcript_19582/m.57989 type:complete len:291 (+) Transcript_19582:811-1683(+)